jgi:hypothetical protein
MLSGVGAYATTQSKHLGAAACNNADQGSSSEKSNSDIQTRKGDLWGELPESAWPSTYPQDVSTMRRLFARLSAQHDRV